MACAAAPAAPVVTEAPTQRAIAEPTLLKPTAVAATATPAAMELRDLAAKRAFYVGAAVSADALRDEPAYAQLLARTYNQVTPENVMKFGLIHPARDRYDWTAADALVAFAEAHAMRVHGHTLVWHQQLPQWIEQGQLTPADARTALHDHILAVVGRYKGRIAEWDVVNEAIDDNARPRDSIWRQLIGPEYVELAFRWAHEADPNAKLFYNDYGGEGMNAKSDAIFALVSDLKKRGVPIDGVGLQLHVSLAGAPAAEELGQNIARIADLGLRVHISELDVRVSTPASAATLKSQAQVYRTVMRACLAAPACTELTTWGFTDAHSWVPGFFAGYGAALPFDERLGPKPAYTAMLAELGKVK